MFKFILPKIHIEIEKWKFNKRYNIYVSNLGNFKDKTKENIKLMVQKGGYLMVPLCNNKKGIVKYVAAHRIVMETWCPKANMWEDKLTVDHLDHNKRNNKTKNLEWVSKEENQQRAQNDFVIDDKDSLIQALKDKVKSLEDKLENKINNEEIKITMIGLKDFDSWASLKKWMIANINPNLQNMKIENLKKSIVKAAKDKTKYMGYNWKVLKERGNENVK